MSVQNFGEGWLYHRPPVIQITIEYLDGGGVLILNDGDEPVMLGFDPADEWQPFSKRGYYLLGAHLALQMFPRDGLAIQSRYA